MPHPTFAPLRLKPYLAAMLESLLESRLEVCLIPSVVPECAAGGGMIRAVVGRNPEWYRDLCAAHPSDRTKGGRFHKGELKTRIKRRDTLAVLVELLHGGSRSGYARDLLDAAEGFAEQAAEEPGGMYAESGVRDDVSHMLY